MNSKDLEIKNYQLEREMLRVQIAMQEKLIHARSKYLTSIFIRVQPPQEHDYEPFTILADKEMGLAK